MIMVAYIRIMRERERERERERGGGRGGGVGGGERGERDMWNNIVYM